MNDTPMSSAPARLYSQTPHDERGNFRYQGDFYRAGEPLPSLAARIERHLADHFRDHTFALRTEKFVGGHKVTAEILDAPDDLTPREAQQASMVAIRDQIERFGVASGNLLQDFWPCAFYCDVRIGQAYWAALAKKRGPRNSVQPLLALAAFRKRIREGDRLKLIDAPKGHRALGTTRTITKVRSADLILDGQSYLSFPRAAAFACDGKLVRIAIGSEYEADAHLLYEWIPLPA
ncbi:hypothetical protein [Sphingomonas oryzagri]